MSIVKRYTAYISSAQRIRGTADEFTVTINPPYVLSNSRNFFRISAVNATIPFSFRQVSSQNNSFYYTINGGSPIAVSITPGNYNINTLLTEVKSQVIASLLTHSITATFTTAYSSTTGRVTWTLATCSPSSTIVFKAGSTVAKMMGLTIEITLPLTTATAFDNHVDVNPIRSLYIRSDNLTQRDNMENVLERSVVSDVLAEVPIFTNPGSYIVLQTATIPVRITNKVIDSIELYLSSTDDYRLLDLDLDWTCNLEIVEVAYEEFKPDIALSSQPIVSTGEDRITELQKEKERLLAKLESEKKALVESASKKK